MISNTAFCIGDSRFFKEPIVHGITPDNCLPCLIFQLLLHFLITLFVNPALQRSPFTSVSVYCIGSLIVSIIYVLYDAFSGVKLIRVGNMMHEENDIVRTGIE